jgi:hypothetical protein
VGVLTLAATAAPDASLLPAPADAGRQAPSRTP